jgi:cation diffusion facilitator CzcD-associated flavoprotein CzcO
MTGRERWAMARIPGAHWLRRAGLYWQMEARVLPLVYDQRVLALGERFARRYIASQIADPVLRERVTPQYRMGCKRVLISNDYYPALTRTNVELVTDGIAEVTPRGVRTQDGREREVDAIILGTGFRVADYLSAMEIRGRGGVDLNATWRAALRSYLGITVAGFPSMFLLMGPGTGLGHNSMIFMIEAQARYAVQAIVAMRARGLASIDVRPDVQAAFHAKLRRQAHGTVWTSGCQSWYQAPSGDLVVWPGFTFDYWRRTRRVELDEFELRRR